VNKIAELKNGLGNEAQDKEDWSDKNYNFTSLKQTCEELFLVFN
jgi:hypothetical protein